MFSITFIADYKNHTISHDYKNHKTEIGWACFSQIFQILQSENGGIVLYTQLKNLIPETGSQNEQKVK